jgi:uncharacterized protein YbjT (DUF2867 family)
MPQLSPQAPHPLNVLLFGATGSAGGSVLKACMASPRVASVRALTRRPLAAAVAASPKLRQIEHRDYADYSEAGAAFEGVDACLFCLGISVTQVSGEAEYRRITHDFALAAAAALRAASPGAVFHYVSGQGAGLDSRFMWARVKAETERELIRDFDAVCWRPAAIDGERSASSPRAYRLLLPLYALLRPFRSLYIAGEDLGLAMLQATAEGVRGRTFENAAIRDLADQARAQGAAG